MVYTKSTGKKGGKMDHLKMRNQLRDMVRQGGFTSSDLPEVVVDDSEYDQEPGGVRLDGTPYGTNSDKNQGQGEAKASSNLNPSSSPWVPTNTIARHNISKVDQPEIAELDGTPKPNINGDAHLVVNAISQNGHHRQNDQHPQNQSIPATEDRDKVLGCVNIPKHFLFTNASNSNSSYLGVPAKNGRHAAQFTMNNSQFISTGYQQSQSIPVMAPYGQLSGSASMGNLDHLTPVRQRNGGLQYNPEGNEAADHADVVSPGSDTPKAVNINGLMTEPRNFAPRTTTDLTRLGAPPKFSLENDSNGKNPLATDAQDPFIALNPQGGPVHRPIFGSHIDTTHLLATEQIPFPIPTGETLNFDDLPRDGNAQSTHNDAQASQAPQIYFGNGGHVMTAHTTQDMATQGMVAHCVPAQGVPAQHVSDSNALANMRAGTYQPLAGHNAALVPYQVGYPPQNAVASYGAPVPDYIRAQRSAELNRLTAGPTGLPTAQVALHEANFPFVDPATSPAHFVVRGVVKIGNIPFVTNRAEIIAVLGRNSRILNDKQEPVHIIMERITGKTTDAYVEFHTLEDASKAVEKYQQNIGRGRVTRIGQRPVDIELSSQAALMKDLFPSAKGVFWAGTNPQILPSNDAEPWDNFKGFVSNEEMTMLVKHVEVPHRSPFSKECPQRPFECLISTLTKFPWHMKANVTVQQRCAIHKATCDLIRILVSSIQERRDELNLTHRLLKRVVTAAMRCEGFSALQKDDVAYLVGMDEMEQRAFGQPRFAEAWRHLYVLVPKTGVPLDVIEWYVAIIREETSRFLEMQSFQDKVQTRTVGNETDAYFGFFWRELNHPVGADFDRMTLSQLAMHEYQTMESIIRRALTPTNVQ
ncbi:rna rnp-1 protein [Colletotrichum incanum]|uniref:Rna rnp-1 protein n=1 Tax=Colletotrichum incanum TaxID=1573173 RepID=A0A167AWT7_COLIC|nr:rna rnp-1 protein [Colletotrichum incanum]OHW97806.1 RNA RNP-1 protein [Colletotrichum incanum]